MSRPTPFSRLLCVLASLALAVLCLLVVVFAWKMRPALPSSSRLLLSPLLGNMEACLVQLSLIHI